MKAGSSLSLSLSFPPSSSFCLIALLVSLQRQRCKVSVASLPLSSFDTIKASFETPLAWSPLGISEAQKHRRQLTKQAHLTEEEADQEEGSETKLLEDEASKSRLCKGMFQNKGRKKGKERQTSATCASLLSEANAP